jgi:trehalose-6-phosphatase
MRIVNPLAILPQVFFAILSGKNQFKPFLYNPIGEIYNEELQLTCLCGASFKVASGYLRESEFAEKVISRCFCDLDTKAGSINGHFIEEKRFVWRHHYSGAVGI